jgi:anhydro-N-acetylmuramic acid kinase
MLDEMLAHEYFARAPPKTTGRELFGASYAQHWIQRAQQLALSWDDIVATFTELTARSISDALVRFSSRPVSQVIVGGGGRHNAFLLQRIEAALRCAGNGARVMPHESIGITSDGKEALVFALLAYLTIHNRPGNVPHCTGASHSVVLGCITPGDNFNSLWRVAAQ